MFAAIDTLRYLRRSGRISVSKSVLGEVVQMKPVISFVEGRLQVIEKPRTMRRALVRMMDLVEEVGPPRLMVTMYASEGPVADRFGDLLVRRYPHAEAYRGPVSAVVGGHAGPGLVGVAASWD